MIPITPADRIELLAMSDELFKDSYEMIKKDITRLVSWITDHPPSHPYDQDYFEHTEQLDEAITWKNFYKQMKREREAIRTPPLKSETEIASCWDSIC